ncbi:MAG: hypothetical protein LBP59_11145 [Planctomycetaceae bacterium]|jgi:ParB family chromosome partitioning protein|nr:hypothetical protein [Planctomycetaceae bacterium]
MKEKFVFHELCVLFPMCSDDELEALRLDVEQNGLQSPITLYEGKILDGRNRAVVCTMLNIKPDYETYLGDDPLGFVLSRNLHRRHLNESQRATIAAKLSTMQDKNYTQEQAAEVMNVSKRIVSDATKLQREADTGTLEAIERGEKTVHAAVKEMKQSELNADEPPPITDEEEQLLFLTKSVSRSAKRLRADLDALFERTGWSPSYKEIHAKVRSIVFDE